jgi:medium-chain acyl-[acyl-carrier-protein] hydrolase
MQLFCFPHAGGSAASYFGWERRLPSILELAPVQLPGRAERLNEPLFTNAQACVEAITTALLPYFEPPFAFFGHSMGAMLAFECARLLQQRYGITPVKLFVLGRRAPHVPGENGPTYNLPEPEFLESVRELNGTPHELLTNPEAMELILPRLRADFELVQTYSCSPGPRLRCPIRALAGREDDTTPPESLSGWQDYTVEDCSVTLVDGDHFSALNDRVLLEVVIDDLCGVLGISRGVKEDGR